MQFRDIGFILYSTVATISAPDLLAREFDPSFFRVGPNGSFDTTHCVYVAFLAKSLRVEIVYRVLFMYSTEATYCTSFCSGKRHARRQRVGVPP